MIWSLRPGMVVRYCIQHGQRVGIVEGETGNPREYWVTANPNSFIPIYDRVEAKRVTRIYQE